MKLSLIALLFTALGLSLGAGGCQTTAENTATTKTTTTVANATPAPKTVATVTTTPAPVSAAATPADNADYVIQPGYKIGKIAIDMERPKVLELLGRPLVTYTSDGVVIDNWGSNSTDNFLQVYYRDNKVAQVEASSPKFATKEGLSTKSTLSQVQRVYKKLNKTARASEGEGEQDAAAMLYFDDGQLGVTFVFLNDKGYTVMVHKPGTEAIITDGNAD